MKDRDAIRARLLRVHMGPLRDIAKGLEIKPTNADTKVDLVSKIVNELLEE